ncbi:MAG TPA: response regulator [Candidatus Paceibacterota bacterium]
MKILVVEDEITLAEALRAKFEKKNYDVRVVSDGGAALASTQSFKPDIILLDLLLPNKNGFEILQDIKADVTLKNIPVIILSNLATDEDIKKAISLGAVDYFVKADHPIQEVLEKVEKQLLKSR